jgi:hypothetical protein
MRILVQKKPEMLMGNSVLFSLTHMVAPSNAPKVPMNVPPEPVMITAKNHKHAPHAQEIIMAIVALWLQTALVFASLMKFVVKLLEKMTTVAPILQYVLFKNEIIMDNYVLCIVLVYATTIKSFATVPEMKTAAKNLHFVNKLELNYGEMTKENCAPDFVLQTAKIGSNCAHPYKILVMAALQSQNANQKLKMLME